MQDLFDKYRAELEEELKLDDFNLKDTQLKLPTIKHKWVARLIQQKIEKNKLKDMRKQAITNIMVNAREQQPVTVSDRVLSQHAEQNELVQKIDQKLQDCDILIEYLEKVEVVCRNTTFDIKNVIEIKKQELT